MWEARVGMKVACIATAEQIAAVKATAPSSVQPVSGGIYTIREIRDDAKYGGDKLVLLFCEIDNSHLIGLSGPNWRCYVEPGFHPDNFRPLRERKTDISIFRAILNGHRVPEDA